MSDPAVAAQRQQQRQQGLIASLVTLPFRFFGVLSGALLLCILIACVGMHFFWPDQGWRHAQGMLHYELDQLSTHFTRSALVQEPGRTAHRLVEQGYDWLFVKSADQRDEFAEFIKGKEDFILKPVDGTHGDGVAKLPASMESFDASLDKMPYLAEERIIQVEEMSALNPSSVNTIRAITFLKDGKATLLAAYVRIGRDGIVDNFCNGGMLTPVDLETGTLMYPAVDGENIAYDIHPITHTSIIGFKVPQWEKIKEMALEAALVVPQVRYVGWDIAVSENGPCLIEGNEYPGHVFYVFAEHHPDHKGCRHIFESVMD